MTTAVAATDFCRNFSKYNRQVQREPIQVKSHETVTGYYVSPEDYDRMQRILAASRRAYHPSELPPSLKEAVRNARMDPRHDHLNALMDDE